MGARSREESKRLDESGELYAFSVITDYVNTVARRLLPDELKQRKDFSLDVRVIRNPLLNAFALAHGAIYVHTGMLAKMDNEAQLATILAHELTHITHRHPIQHFRTFQTWSTTLAVLEVALMPAGAYGNLVTLFGAIGATAAVSGYSRSMENEADSNGLALLIHAGYDPAEAPKLFDHLQKDLEEQKIEEPFFFGSHPKLQERKANYTELIAKSHAERIGEKGDERYAEIMFPLLFDNAQMDLALGRWAWAEDAIRRSIAVKADDPKGHYQLGELFRQRAHKGDEEAAAANYRAALEKDQEFAPAHRGLGFIARKAGDAIQARRHFERYLSLAPSAQDRLYVQQYLDSPDGSGATP